MAGWQPPQYDPRRQQPPAPRPPEGYGQPWQALGWQSQQPPPTERRTVTVQTGSTGFHVFMCIMTGGLWLLVWPFFRRKAHVTTRYR